MHPFVRVGAVLLFLSTGCSRPAIDAAPRRLSIASWNIEWLASSEGMGEVPRTASDYARLADYARQLDADVVALQEIDGEQAARRVFDPALYDFHFTADARTPQRTGFAWRKTLHATARPDVTELAIAGPRRGADLDVEIDGRHLRLLSIHLKAGCDDRPLTSSDLSCRTLAAQIPALESWIDARAREGVPYAVLGDFNRRFGERDELWSAIDDGDPPGAELIDVGSAARSPELIDHIVLGGQARSWLAVGSFRRLAYSSADQQAGTKLSDHRPIAVILAPAGASGSPPETSGSPSDASPATLRADQAKDHVGEYATVCGVVASARHLDASNGGPTFLNLDRPHPDQPFTVFIRSIDRAHFDRAEVIYLRKRICVSGTIETHDGKPEIVAREPSQIVSAD